ncbi:hypothetical protein BpHYR1_050494 [Brachionus plicatilis]|uniref:Uncharacterized protein n=1 Tax=Brachionus plicatilis TaxID=10195 RepID=A0A3M7QE23_BRAPC|nr:hypothetical protein BpHYR1_050494 [Brachionus plicatilis]
MPRVRYLTCIVSEYITTINQHEDLITFNLIFDKNSNKCDKKNGPNKHFHVNCYNKNMTFAFKVVLGWGQLWPAGLRPEFNDQLAGQYKRSILAVKFTAAFKIIRELAGRLSTVFVVGRPFLGRPTTVK